MVYLAAHRAPPSIDGRGLRIAFGQRIDQAMNKSTLFWLQAIYFGGKSF
jgi:hypothetical protein